MGVDSRIEWTDDTWNFIVGCTRVSSGCAHCYAIRDVWRMAHNPNPKIAGPRQGIVEQQPNGQLDWTGKIGVLPDRLAIPLRKQQPTRYFVNSLSDLFHENVPNKLIEQAFGVMAATPRHTYQILTKRPDRMREWVRRETHEGVLSALLHKLPDFGFSSRQFHADVERIGAGFPWPLPNVWLGTSVEDQKAADLRIHDLQATPAAVRFLSCEPLLGPIDFAADRGRLSRQFSETVGVFGYVSAAGPTGANHHPGRCVCQGDDTTPHKHYREPPFKCARCLGCGGFTPARPLWGIHWVIAGGESGANARPMHPDWARSLRDQCANAGVAFFFKQHGEWLSADQAQFPPRTDPIWTNWSSDRTQPLTPAGRLKRDERWLDPGDAIVARLGKRRAGRELDGRTWDEYPAAAGIQPTAAAVEHA